MIKGKLKISTKINLDFTFNSGQIFRWKKSNDWWYGILNHSLFLIKIKDNYLFYKIKGRASKENLLDFFNLFDNYENILNILKRDKKIEFIIKKYEGLRLLKQDKWECLISYLCSSFNNIKRINLILEKLSYLSKRKYEIGNLKVYDFPYPEELAKFDEKFFRKLGLGFRARYLEEISKKINNNELDLNSLNYLKTKDIRRILISIKGIGKKIADCILLYSYNRLEIFPIDTWIKRAIIKFYNKELSTFLKVDLNGKNIDKFYDKITYFLNKKFLNYSGYLQLFLFKYIREL